jgi:hypothetical protein
MAIVSCLDIVVFLLCFFAIYRRVWGISLWAEFWKLKWACGHWVEHSSKASIIDHMGLCLTINILRSRIQAYLLCQGSNFHACFFKQQGLKFVGGQFLGLGLREPLFRWCHLFFNLFIFYFKRYCNNSFVYFFMILI